MLETTLTPELIAEQLNSFSGSLDNYRYRGGLLLSEGVHWLASEVGTCWLLDLILEARATRQVKAEAFQVYVLKTHSAYLKCHDGDGETLWGVNLPYTDFPLNEVTIWVIDGVAILPGEY